MTADQLSAIRARLAALTAKGMGIGGMSRVMFNESAPSDIAALLQEVERLRESCRVEKQWRKTADTQLARLRDELSAKTEKWQHNLRAVIEHATGIDCPIDKWETVAQIWNAIDQKEVDYAHESSARDREYIGEIKAQLARAVEAVRRHKFGATMPTIYDNELWAAIDFLRTTEGGTDGNV